MLNTASGIGRDTDGGRGLRGLNLSLGTLGTFRVNVQGTNDQANPRVALLKNGGAVFVWQGGISSQEQIYARFVLGAAASAIVPVLSLLLLLSTRQSPIIGWGSLWQWVVMGVGGGLMTVACFWIFDWLNGALNYHPVAQSSFRQDREIARGRN